MKTHNGMGIYQGMSDEDYFKLDGLHQSQLKEIYNGIKQFEYKLENRKEPSKEMKFGSAADAFVLTPETFDEKYRVIKKLNWATKDGKEQKEEVKKLEQSGVKIITQEEMDALGAIKESLEKHPSASLFLKDCVKQVVLKWTDKEYGVDCVAKLDGVIATKKSHFIFDLKTTGHATKDKFFRKIIDYSYDIQAAFYLRGYKQITGIDAQYFWIVVQSTAPYSVAVYRFPDDELIIAHTELKNLLEKYNKYLENKKTTDLNNDEVVDFRYPSYYLNKLYSTIY